MAPRPHSSRPGHIPTRGTTQNHNTSMPRLPRGLPPLFLPGSLVLLLSSLRDCCTYPAPIQPADAPGAETRPSVDITLIVLDSLDWQNAECDGSHRHRRGLLRAVHRQRNGWHRRLVALATGPSLAGYGPGQAGSDCAGAGLQQRPGRPGAQRRCAALRPAAVQPAASRMGAPGLDRDVPAVHDARQAVVVAAEERKGSFSERLHFPVSVQTAVALQEKPPEARRVESLDRRRSHQELVFQQSPGCEGERAHVGRRGLL